MADYGEDEGVELQSVRPGTERDSEREPLSVSGARHYGSRGSGGSVHHVPRATWEPLKSYLMFWKSKHSAPTPPRTVLFNDYQTNRLQRFRSNRISTTKYNLLTFLPRFLFDQFRRYANLFFLFIGILQQLPGVSPTGRFTTFVPLALVLLATAIKEVIEDIRRLRADNQVNKSKVKVLRDGALQTMHWTKVVVGDIVLVENRHFFPADLLLLSSSEPQGLCYVETSNLDGETNLKIRQAHALTVHCDSVAALSALEGQVEYEGPNSRLYEFTGNMHIQGEQLSPVQADQILLRGSQLRNTAHVYGLVLYSGHDAKLLRNALQAPLKRSNVEHVTNRQVIFLFASLLVLALLSTIAAAVWNGRELVAHWYFLASSHGSLGSFLRSFLTFIVLYNNLIPISLIVSLEIVKFIQAFFINYDREMYDACTDTPALARNSNLNEELGQVKYVFSDKTGTLTENIMEFKKCSIAGQIYSMDGPSSGQFPSLGLREALHSQQAKEEEEAALTSSSSSSSSSGGSGVLEFLRVLALCHSVIPEQEGGELVFRASSPDEEALVGAAKALGVVFKTRTPKCAILEVCGREERFEVLNLLEFNSERKRMSVIVRLPDGSLKLLCKGADSVIYPRLLRPAAGEEEEEEGFAAKTERHLEHFAISGLRTLCVAEATLSEEAYAGWSVQYRAASTALSEQERLLDEAAEAIEKDLTLLGATAIEDKLQMGVPESIATLRAAGVKVWVLTGDKQETAINIGFSSCQLSPDMKLVVVNEASSNAVDGRLQSTLTELGPSDKERNAALIIDGKSLGFALDSRIQEKFLKLALACKSVICCRVSPVQKADTVRVVREKVKGAITLAIGDGANDVSMIQSAHIGVGISGREGLQATLASDYSIAQFRFLLRLMLVHGVWSYHRVTKLILYSFYKNICLYIIEFWFSFLNGFSGQPLFERWTIGLFNVLFTFVAPLTLGLFDQDVSASGRLARPSLYLPSQQGKGFNTWVFWKWVLLSVYHSLVLYFGIYYMLSHETPFENGKVIGLWYVGNTVYTCVVVTVNLKLALESNYWPWIHHVAVWGSIAMWFFFLLVYSHFWPTFPLAVEMVGQDVKLYSSLSFYALFVLAPAVAMLPDFIWTVVQKSFLRSEVDSVRQREIRQQGKTDGYESLESLSVSYSSRSSRYYGDGLDEPIDSVTYVPPHGYAFSQEDHGLTKKGTRVQRRDMIRMYDTRERSAAV